MEMICRKLKLFSQKHATASVPLPYQPENNDIPVQTPPTGFDALRTIAVSRIYLDNFDHITAYWVGLGLKLAQVALKLGADDLHGTIIEEHIFHMAGATSPQLQTEAEMVKAILPQGGTAARRCNETRFTNRSKFGTARHRRRKLNHRRANPKCWKMIWRRREALVKCGMCQFRQRMNGFPQAFVLFPIRRHCSSAGGKREKSCFASPAVASSFQR